MKFILTLISSLFIFGIVTGQDSIHVVRQYENDKPVTAIDSVFHKIHNAIFISFDEGFDDSLYVTVNGVPFLDSTLKTNESIGYAGGFGIHFKDSSEIKYLVIKFVKANRCIRERLNLRYKSLQVRGLEPWLLIYTNRFPMRM